MKMLFKEVAGLGVGVVGGDATGCLRKLLTTEHAVAPLRGGSNRGVWRENNS